MGGLGGGLLHGDGLGEVVNAHVQTGGTGVLQMPGKGAVCAERTLGIAGIADPEDGELHPLRRQPLPVHIGLVIGHIHAQPDGTGHADIMQCAVLCAGKVGGGEGVHR